MQGGISRPSRVMRDLNGVYTQAYNRRHAAVGALSQGRFKAILVDRDGYLPEVCSYVDLNPVRAGLGRDPADLTTVRRRRVAVCRRPPGLAAGYAA